MILRHDLLKKEADGSSAGPTEKKITNTKIHNVRKQNRDQKVGSEGVAGVVISDELTPAQASLLFEEFKSKNPGTRERFKFAAAIIRKLCELGYTQEAWELIEKDRGNVRTNQLAAFFTNAKSSHSELLGRILDAQREDVHVSLSGFMSRFKPEQYEEIIRSPDFRSFLGGLDRLDPNEAKLIKNNISSGLGNVITIFIFEAPNQTSEILRIAARLNSEGVLDTPRFMDLAARFGRGDPFGNWDLISAIQSGEDRVAGLRSNMIRDMLEVDAPKALSKILDNIYPGKASDISSAIGSWVNLDAKGATDWFQQNRGILSPQDSDTIAAAFSMYAGDLSEYPGAQQWAEQIRDPKMKAEVLKKIAEAAAAKQERAGGTQ